MSGDTAGGRRRGPGLREDDSGQALVEFALVVPILLLLLIGILSFARAWNVHQALTDAAREGARTAVLANPEITTDSVRATIRGSLTRSMLNGAAAQITVTGVDGSPGTPTEVRVTYPMQMPVLRFLGRSPVLDLSTAVVMRHE